MQKIIIYQILVRLFGNKKTKCRINGTRKENGIGTFRDISDIALKEIKKLGITHVWYTGILEHMLVEGYKKYNIKGNNPNIVKGLAGSPFAIKDYYDVNPDLAKNPAKRMKEWKNLVIRSHNNGLKVIIDFIPNHVAREYYSDKRRVEINDFGIEDNKNISFSPQNDFYYLSDKKLVLHSYTGTKHPNFKNEEYIEYPAKATGNDKFTNVLTSNDWYDTVKLNYGINFFKNKEKHFEPIPSVWWKMLDILLFWGKNGVDGFRCDMVDMVPLEFWEWIVPQVKEKFPEVIFIAETYQPDLFRKYIDAECFDYLYDKVFTYNTLRDILQKNIPASTLTNCWKNLEGINDRMLRFLENHDEQRIASKNFLQNPFYAIPGMLLLATFHNNPLMIYFGQEVGEAATGKSGYSGDDGKTTIYDYWHVPEHQRWLNSGKFNEKKLSLNQQKLRKFYVNLLQFCKSYDVFTKGSFYDLNWANNHPSYNAEKIYSYLRYTHKRRILIVLNFDKHNSQNAKVIIPEDAFSCMKMELSSKLIFNIIYGNAQTIHKTNAMEMSKDGIDVKLEPHSGVFFELKFRL